MEEDDDDDYDDEKTYKCTYCDCVRVDKLIRVVKLVAEDFRVAEHSTSTRLNSVTFYKQAILIHLRYCPWCMNAARCEGVT